MTKRLMRLNVNDSDSVRSPTETDLARCMAELSGDEFAILSQRTGYFVQTYLNSDGTFQLEYRQGSSDQHFFVDSASITVKEVTRVFLLFMQEPAALNTGWDWQPQHLDSQGPVVDDQGEIPADAMVEYHGVLMSADWPREIEEAQERRPCTMEGERWSRMPLKSFSHEGEASRLSSECGVRVTNSMFPDAAWKRVHVVTQSALSVVARSTKSLKCRCRLDGWRIDQTYLIRVPRLAVMDARSGY